MWTLLRVKRLVSEVSWHKMFCAKSSTLQNLESKMSVLKHLTSKISATGPISVAEYMREALTNPVAGYYVWHNMIGTRGDFITSPEVSQVFGELLGIWCISEWMAAGKSKVFQLVELGPGRGSLSSDILRVFRQLKSGLSEVDVSFHLVEVSQKLSQCQAMCLTGGHMLVNDGEQPFYGSAITSTGLPVYWYHRVEDVPRGFSIYLAHEFFDALPIHKFQKTEKGWREVLIDIDPGSPNKLRFVISRSPTLASRTLVQENERRPHVEVCPDAGVIVQQLAKRVAEDGGAALIADYGHNGTKTDTFRGFKDHQLHNVLEATGLADLTADVDFSYLRKMCGREVTCLGPISQRSFLKNMGIDMRLQVLLKHCRDSSIRTQLLHSHDMLINPDKMGQRFQFFSLLHPGRVLTSKNQTEKDIMLRTLSVAGFSELTL